VKDHETPLTDKEVIHASFPDAKVVRASFAKQLEQLIREHNSICPKDWLIELPTPESKP
jgi:hypothetical protein